MYLFICKGPGQRAMLSTCVSACACSVASSSLHPIDCSPPGSSVLGILQVEILEWVAISFSKGSLWPSDRTHVSCISMNFDHCATCIMGNARQDEAQAGIKIARRNISNLRYADDTTLMPEMEEELKSLLMKVREENEKAGLKLRIQKTKIMASGPIIHGK